MSSMLILGAGEPGLPIIHSLSRLSSTLLPFSRPTLTVLLRPSTISFPSKAKSKGLASIRDLADVSASTASELASHFKKYDTIISCTGFSGGAGTQMELAKGVLEAGVKHTTPGNLARIMISSVLMPREGFSGNSAKYESS
ncbi:MAG: hypothetical protein Q9188_003705 [Gyalolechia gomerana]